MRRELLEQDRALDLMMTNPRDTLTYATANLAFEVSVLKTKILYALFGPKGELP
jgi:hypothetical protein